MVATQQEILSALLFEKEEQFEIICNPPPVEGEAVEDGAEPQKPNLSFRDNFGQTPLEKAAVLGRVALLPKLLENGELDVNLADPQGYTSLHKASSWGRINAVSCLLEHGADISLKTCHGETARDIAVRYRHEGTVFLLDLTRALQDFRASINDIHSQVTDPERIVGKLNKEEKQTSNRMCEEALAWTSSPEAQETNLEAVAEKQAQFEEAMNQYLVKIAPPPSAE